MECGCGSGTVSRLMPGLAHYDLDSVCLHMNILFRERKKHGALQGKRGCGFGKASGCGVTGCQSGAFPYPPLSCFTAAMVRPSQ